MHHTHVYMVINHREMPKSLNSSCVLHMFFNQTGLKNRMKRLLFDTPESSEKHFTIRLITLLNGVPR